MGILSERGDFESAAAWGQQASSETPAGVDVLSWWTGLRRFQNMAVVEVYEFWVSDGWRMRQTKQPFTVTAEENPAFGVADARRCVHEERLDHLKPTK